jgi:hypothetical protein
VTLERAEQLIDACIADRDRTVGDDEFNAVALEVFAHQYESVPLYRRLCELRGASPAAVDHWSRIPAAPADLFKEDLGTSAGVAEFLSSGTTQGTDRRSRQAVSARSYALYRRSSLAHFSAMVLPDSPGPMAVLVLGPLAATHAHSSLGHMFGFVVDAVSDGGADSAGRGADPAGRAADSAGGNADAIALSAAHQAASVAHPFDAEGSLDVEAALAWLEDAAASTRPVLVLALSSAITAVFEALRNRKLALRLPADSRLVDTGGNKGGRTLSRAGMLKAAWRFLHIPAYLCIGEYGMTELLSQFYEDAWHSRWSGRLEPRANVGPPWTRTLAVDPATLEPVARSERGILRHVDLANFESISALQTLDLGAERGRGFEVTGRARDAETRGCSQLMQVLSP